MTGLRVAGCRLQVGGGWGAVLGLAVLAALGVWLGWVGSARGAAGTPVGELTLGDRVVLGAELSASGTVWRAEWASSGTVWRAEWEGGDAAVLLSALAALGASGTVWRAAWEGYADEAVAAAPTNTLADAAAAGPFAGHEAIEVMMLTASNLVLRTVSEGVDTDTVIVSGATNYLTADGVYVLTGSDPATYTQGTYSIEESESGVWVLYDNTTPMYSLANATPVGTWNSIEEWFDPPPTSVYGVVTLTNTVTFSVTQTGELQIDADLDMGGRSIINIGNESLKFADGASISFTNSVFAVKRASPQAPEILFNLNGGRMINVRGFHYSTPEMFPGPGTKWGFDVGGASLTNIANESLVFEDGAAISASRITTTGGVDVTYEALHKVANIAYPVFDLPLGGEWSDFEIKASTNNFASNETMVYYYVSTTNQVWRPEIGDPEAAAWYTDDYSADPRVWRRKPEAGSIFAQLADPTNSVVPRVIFAPSLGVDEAFASWMYPHNPRLVWSFVRVGPLGFEQNASGTGQRWHPIRPVSWEYQRPDP